MVCSYACLDLGHWSLREILIKTTNMVIMDQASSDGHASRRRTNCYTPPANAPFGPGKRRTLPH